jgi:NAD(P)-dependent dehydrogenase (short-subunit alcohol dehydrogenase family)
LDKYQEAARTARQALAVKLGRKKVDMNLTQKVAIVTGAARGIGLAIASRLCEAGANVVLTDLEVAGLDGAVASIRKDHPSAQCLAVRADVTSRASIEAMIQEVISKFGRIDVLVANAGVWKNLTRGPFWQLSNDEWRKAFSVNTEGAFNCAAAVSPHMIKQNSGRIIFIGSAAIGEALADVTHYAASKAALTGLMRCVAKELGKNGITVNMINPGQIDTGGVTRERLEMRAKSKFIQRVAIPSDLTGIVTFLASEEGGYITAQQIYVDGGGVLN